MTVLLTAAPTAIGDVATFATRVATLEADAVIRVVARGMVVGFLVETPFEALALRAVTLAESAEVDEVVEAGTLAARASGGGRRLELPPPVPALRWTSSMPPRSGWSELARLPLAAVRAQVEEGIAEFRGQAPNLTQGLSLRAGRTALEGLASQIWDREFAAGVPLRVAHASFSYGFLSGGDQVVLRSSGAWRRMDAPHGSVLARGGLALFAL